jgi:hypothetical protein
MLKGIPYCELREGGFFFFLPAVKPSHSQTRVAGCSTSPLGSRLAFRDSIDLFVYIFKIVYPEYLISDSVTEQVGSSSKAFDLFSGHDLFESLPEHRLYRLGFFVVPRPFQGHLRVGHYFSFTIRYSLIVV